ncbi:hypothetical protein CV023_08055 [Brevibacterium sp. CCUG 69071]|nr:hypothetical protein [Brevibacterium sp. CCUG 69071]
MVGPAQLPVLFLEVLDPLGISGGGAGPQCFRVHAELVTDTAEHVAAGTGVGFECVEDHADRSLTKLERVFPLGHDGEVPSMASLSPLFPGRITIARVVL